MRPVRPLRSNGKDKSAMANARVCGVGEGSEKGDDEDRESDENDSEGERVEEGERPRIMRGPHQPTREEFDEHMATHIPYRSWCPYCIKGKARASPHRQRREGIPDEVAVVAIDYMYMKSSEKEEGIGMPILVMRDRTTGWIAANVVPRKGKDPYAVKRLS